MNLKQQVYGLTKKVTNVGGDYIANHLMVTPGLDQIRGQQADERRAEVMQNNAIRKANLK